MGSGQPEPVAFRCAVSGRVLQNPIIIPGGRNVEREQNSRVARPVENVVLRDMIAGWAEGGQPVPPSCPITLMPPDDPVHLILPETTRSYNVYEAQAIKRWFATGGTTVPTTRQSIQTALLRPDLNMRALLHPDRPPPAARWWREAADETIIIRASPLFYQQARRIRACHVAAICHATVSACWFSLGIGIAAYGWRENRCRVLVAAPDSDADHQCLDLRSIAATNMVSAMGSIVLMLPMVYTLLCHSAQPIRAASRWQTIGYITTIGCISSLLVGISLYDLSAGQTRLTPVPSSPLFALWPAWILALMIPLYLNAVAVPAGPRAPEDLV